MNAILTLENVTVKFGGLTALQNLNLIVQPKSITGIIGPNGAGKTTAFNIITGVYKPSSGQIILGNKDITKLEPHLIAEQKISRTFQNIRLFSNMTVLENIIASAYLKRKHTFFSSLLLFKSARKKEKELFDYADTLLKLCELEKYKTALATSLPYGMQRKLEIARALMTEPKLILLDEPAAGLNQTEKNNLQTLIRKIVEQGTSVLLIEHDMKFVMNLCDQITVLNYGETIATGDPKSIQENPKVIEAYLGASDDHSPAN